MRSFETLTILEVAPSTILQTAEDTSNCCEDCPDVNENPPSQSECPYFFPIAGGRPECLREKNTDFTNNNEFS
jgi:hypothetical protein